MDPLGRNMATSETYRALASSTISVAEEYCEGRMLALHEDGYSTAYVPFCGLATLEAMAGGATGVNDPFLPIFNKLAGQDTQPHQRHVIDLAASLVARA